jgi:hypothetical protein
MVFDNGFGWFFGGFWLFSIAGLVLMIWALVDCLKVPDDSRYQSGTKLVWVLVIVLVWVIGPIIYLLIGRPKAVVGGAGNASIPPPGGPSGSVPPPPPGALD